MPSCLPSSWSNGVEAGVWSVITAILGVDKLGDISDTTEHINSKRTTPLHGVIHKVNSQIQNVRTEF
ncbi:hypothetical protein GN958_ATG01421 [Phytophthora infestans]|uniref:Uncharacterized protein n=1 Tax=Phytophthora infestans TaxID=4787 RepID=A0A8S9VE23_PHYIN|nr:hypothetical protein GN958_ATG01421 [Phytophthora infestans]